ncbi:MAG: right-handed parallel beta-helix repeat-containing protein [Verrucomicrobiota bacterium]
MRFRPCARRWRRRGPLAPRGWSSRPDATISGPTARRKKYCFVSNNDPGLKRIAFPLDHAENLEIDGGGARFVFHGFVNPFVLDGAKKITLKHFSIDWARSFDSEAKILAVRPGSVDLQFSDQFPYRIDPGGVLTFIDRESPPNVYPAGGLLEFDPVRQETAFQAPDQFVGPTYFADALAPGQVRLKLDNFQGTPGNTLVFGDGARRCPAIIVSDSAQTRIEGVTIYHAGGMGIIAQRSRDITLDHVQVTPSPNSGRLISASADATHFVNCRGQIAMTNCLFENQEDDATNIHGIYARIESQTSPTEFEVRLVHPQQLGFDFITPGEGLELVHAPSLVTFGQVRVRKVERLNSEYARVTVEEPLPKECAAGDVVASIAGYPDVLVSHCVIRRNRARGLLLGSRGKIIIENNTFHTPGAAILFEGDACHWFEQSGVRDCLIRNNTFDTCNYGVWGRAAIEVGSHIDPADRAHSRYNRNLRIEDNTFRVFDPRILNVTSVDGLVFRRNQIVASSDYPATHAGAERFDVTFSDNVSIDDAAGQKHVDNAPAAGAGQNGAASRPASTVATSGK